MTGTHATAFRRAAIGVACLVVFGALFGSGKVILQRSALAQSTALFIPDDSLVYQGKLTGLSVQQLSSSLLVSATSQESVALVKTRTQVLSGATVTVNVPDFEYQATLNETSQGVYQAPTQLDVTLTPALDGSPLALSGVQQWSVTPQAATFTLGTASLSASGLAPIKLADALSKVDVLNQSLGGLPPVSGFIAGAGIQAKSTASTYQVPVTVALQGTVQDGNGKPVAGRTLAVNVAPDGLASRSFSVSTDASGGFSYDVTLPATITVSGGAIANLPAVFQMQGVTTDQVSAFWWGGGDSGGASSQQTNANLGSPTDPNAQGGSDPVNIVTGNMYDVETDVSYPSPGIPVSFQRTYNSQDPRMGVLGRGWADSFGLKVEQTQHDGNATLTETTASGARIVWTQADQNGDFSPPAGVHGSLRIDQGDNTYYKRDKYGVVTHYLDGNAGGMVDWVRDPNGNQMSFAYNGSGQLVAVTDTAHRSLSLVYDSNGRLTSVTDPLGNAVAYSYDSLGNLASVTYPGGSKVGYAYDGSGNLVQVTDPDGNHRSFTYDASGRATSFAYDGGLERTSFRYDPAHNRTVLTDAQGFQTVYDYQYVGASGVIDRITDPMGAVTSYQWDSDVNRVAVTDPLGHSTKMTYDGQGNLTSLTDALGELSRATYDSTFSRPLTYTDPLGATTKLEYDAQGNLVSLTDAVGAATHMATDARGLVTLISDGLRDTTTLEYDAAGDATKVTDPVGSSTRFSYDRLGHVVAISDQLGRLTTLGYDAQYRPLKLARPDGTTTSMSYDPAGNLISTTDALGRTTSFAYNQANQPTQLVDPLKRAKRIQYNVRGQASATVDPTGSATVLTYDPAGNVAKVIQPDGSFAILRHDPSGHVIGTADPDGHVTSYKYDSAGRLITATDAMGGVTAYRYDAGGRRLSVTDPDGHTTSTAYDATGRVAKVTDPDGHAWAYTYDAAGRLVSAVDALGATTTYSYDAAGHPRRSAYADGESVSATYDAGGRVATMTDGLGVTTYTYDTLDRVVKQSLSGGSALTATYDAAGERTSLTTPAGATSYQYDAGGEISRIVDPAKGVTSYLYDLAGRVTKESLPNGASSAVSYDSAGHAAELVNTTSDGSTDRFGYIYDAFGNVTAATRNQAQVQFGYDALNRLTSVGTPSGGGIRYSYDAAGNRLTQASFGLRAAPAGDAVTGGGPPDGTISYSYDAANELLSAGAEKFSYDADGQLTASSGPDGEATYSWDSRHLLASVQSGDQRVSYGYDGLGRMVRRQSSDGGSIQNLYDGLNLVAQRQLPDEGTSGGAAPDLPGWTAYATGNRGLIGSFRLNGDGRSAETRYFQYDRLGSLSDVTDQSGRRVAQLAYTPWGAPATGGGRQDGRAAGSELGGTQRAGFASLAFIGQPYDLADGLARFNARWYSPSLGRFISRDPYPAAPADPQTLNRYAYALDNPVTYSDPLGLSVLQFLNGLEYYLHALAPLSNIWGDFFGNVSTALALLGMVFGVLALVALIVFPPAAAALVFIAGVLMIVSEAMAVFALLFHLTAAAGGDTAALGSAGWDLFGILVGRVGGQATKGVLTGARDPVEQGAEAIVGGVLAGVQQWLQGLFAPASPSAPPAPQPSPAPGPAPVPQPAP